MCTDKHTLPYAYGMCFMCSFISVSFESTVNFVVFFFGSARQFERGHNAICTSTTHRIAILHSAFFKWLFYSNVCGVGIGMACFCMQPANMHGEPWVLWVIRLFLLCKFAYQYIIHTIALSVVERQPLGTKQISHAIYWNISIYWNDLSNSHHRHPWIYVYIYMY